jgi:hypothetical protein
MTRSWVWTFLLGLILFGVYIANGRAIDSDDTEPTRLLAFALTRGDGPYLDRFGAGFEIPGLRPPPFATRWQGHWVSLYPVAPALLAAPIAWPTVAVRDLLLPGWDRSLTAQNDQANASSKFAAAVIVAMVGMALDRVLRLLGLGKVAPFAVLAAGLASNLWAVASQAMWQHGPAALALTLMVGLLLPNRIPRWKLAAAGITAGALVAFRMIDVIFSAAALAYVARTRPRGLIWFLPGPLLIGGALVVYHIHTFGTVLGGLAQVEMTHPERHGVAGTWSGDLIGGALGTLFSPSRGLFVFSPWVALALALLPAYWRSLRSWPLLLWMLAALAADLLVLSKYAVWWAGHSFGPRYWIDAVPLFAILLAFALEWCRDRCRPMLVPIAVAILWGLGVQVIGAFLYPSGWNATPADVDTHHERLWNWADSELTRCLLGSSAMRGR